MPLVDWLKNRYNPKATIKTDVKISCPPNNEIIPISILLDGGKRKMGKIDEWMATHIGKPDYQEIVFVIGLNPSHGPAVIRSILEKIQELGDPAMAEKKEFFQWYPKEILFIGPAIQQSNFDGLKKIIRNYRGQSIIVPTYVDHVHREHTPHHSFYRCTITGWRWKVGDLTADNFPQQIYPKQEN
jgi:hypothetical protein